MSAFESSSEGKRSHQKEVEEEEEGPSATTGSGKRRRVEAEVKDTNDPDQQIKETVLKLKKYLLQDTKFEKAVELMTQLVQTHLRNEITELIVDTIEEICSQRDVLHKDFKAGCVELVEAVYLRREELNPMQTFRVDTLHILVVLQNKLATDDSFEFSRCCSSVNSFIPAIPSYSPELEGLVSVSTEQREALLKLRLKALMSCMKTAFKLYSSRPWSKQPVDGLFTSASDVRLHVPLSEREVLDELITTLRSTQRRNASYTGPMTIRTFNSTAHPLRSSKFDILK